MPIVLLVIAVAGLVPRAADACSCLGPRQPCEAVWKARYVFTGAVAAIRTEQGQRVVTFRVERTWRHDIPGRSLPESVTVSTPRDGAACGYEFERGRTDLVYADASAMNAAALTTHACTRTRPIDEAAEDLAYFAEMESGARTARIFGRLRPFADDASPPVAGAVIELRSPSAIRTATTGSGGAFEFRGVAPHSYEVTARLAPAQVPARSREPIWIAHATACVEVDLIARWDGQIAGPLVDAAGAPLRHVEIEARERGARIGVTLATDDGGRFTFAGLAPGTYSIGMNLSSFGRGDPPAEPMVLRDDVRLGPGTRAPVGALRVPPR